MSFLNLPSEIYGEILSSMATYHFLGILTVSKEIRENIKKVVKPIRTIKEVKEAIKNEDLLRIILHVNISQKIFVLQRLCSQGSLACLKKIHPGLFLPFPAEEKRYKKKILGKAFVSGCTELVKYLLAVSPSLLQDIDYNMTYYLTIACFRGCIRLKKNNKDDKDHMSLIDLLPYKPTRVISYFPMDYASMREDDWEDLDFYFSIPSDPDFSVDDIYLMIKMARKREDSRIFCSIISSLIEKNKDEEEDLEEVVEKVIRKIHKCKSIESTKYFLSRLPEVKNGITLLRKTYENVIDKDNIHIRLIQEYLIV